MSRREGTFTFTFSKRNWDIKELTDGMKEADANFRITEYFCEAARFFEKFKGKVDALDESKMAALIDERIKKAMANVPFSEAKDEEAVTINTIDSSFTGNLENVKIDED